MSTNHKNLQSAFRTKAHMQARGVWAMNKTLDERRNTEGYLDLNTYQALKNLQRATYGYRPLVYICSPFSRDVEANIALARRFCAHAVAAKKIPLARDVSAPVRTRKVRRYVVHHVNLSAKWGLGAAGFDALGE
ncbi:hypothetical protein [uncultured Mobiluncus sp.]|uniref:DUF7768 domain-containing protein n=1 Tax=uncultured Mobiluncus sp. TaxID=293425 RepID=UPI00288BE90C|nr:hypothetical protein [uncultured Mobiluncus sp.]